MKNSQMTSALRAGFAAVFALAAHANASDWCPTSTDNTISCSNCTRTLTCDTYGIQITIAGSNVFLDGAGHGIYNSPNNGVQVTGANPMIHNLVINDPVNHGIFFYHQSASPDYASVYNVNVHYAHYGLVNAWSTTNISVGGSAFSWNYMGVVNSDIYGDSPKWLDLYSSHVTLNSYTGYFSNGALTEYHWDNQYNWNVGSGAVEESWYNGGYYHDSYFVSNGAYGLSVNSPGATLQITNNYGVGNSSWDCVAHYGSKLYAENNTWNRNGFCVTSP